MKTTMRSFLRRAYRDENAQVLPMMAVLMVGFLGMTAMVADVGDVYYSYNELQASTNAAALAGAEGLPTSGAQATAYAKAYSSQSGGSNLYGNLNITNATYTLGCVTGSVSSGIRCISTGSGSNTANAIQVTQTAAVRTYFAAVFGTSSVSLTATATGLMPAPSTTAYNIAVVIDTTASMSTSDTSCGTGQTRLSCSLSGVQTLLGSLNPCTAAGCGSLTSGNYANSLDRVSLFTFPELSDAAQATDDTNCSGTRPGITPYTFPSSTGTTYSPGTTSPTYQVTPYLSNYQTVTSGNPTGTLNGSSTTVDAVGGKSGCAGMSDPGGEGTYYAGVIYAAEASLIAEQAANPGSQNSLIIVSDGAATSSKSQMSSGAGSSGTYPSYNNECQQAVTAAQAGTAAGITVYSVAYGSPTSGCTTDSGSYTSPCYTMQQMASVPSGKGSTFYSDDSSSGACPATNAPAALADIFSAISAGFGKARLVPNGTFP